jgi:hypothetical protein
MKIKIPINENYAGTIIKIGNIIPLDNCTNVVHTSIFGNSVVISKDTKIGDIGIFFPVETKLSSEYLYNNNLYRINTLNKDTNEKGYFEENGRIRCVKFRGHKSEGLFMPLKSLLFAVSIEELSKIDINITFDELNGIKICEKYIINNLSGFKKDSKNDKVYKKKSKIIENQFRFHQDTAMLGKNMHRIKKDSLVQISSKLHGTSYVVSKILCNKKQKWWEKLLQLPTKIDYEIIYSSRKVIKNDDLNKNYRHYYNEDVWKEISDYLEPYLVNGMTIYGEAVGYTKSGSFIQKGYDYGCSPNEMKVYIYRITLTNNEGKVFEFSAKQVKEWCLKNGLYPMPEYYYGYAYKLFVPCTVEDGFLVYTEDDNDLWQEGLLNKLLTGFNMEKDCELCHNKVPAEGIVLRIEGLDYEAYKLKSFRFRQRETELLDKEELDLESQN